MKQLTATDSLEIPPGGLNNKGFVWSYAGRLRAEGASISRAGEIMHCSHTTRVPILSTLAREFAVCTRWFSSLPSETWPNRLFAHAAQSDNLVHNVPRRYGIRSIFDALRGAGVSWAVYAGDIPQAAAFIRPAMSSAAASVRSETSSRTSSAGSCRTTRSSSRPTSGRGRTANIPPSGRGAGSGSSSACTRRWRRTTTSGTGCCLSSLYDEHGGFYDHVAPPAADPPHEGDRDPVHGFEFNLLGPRVPAVVVSPIVRRGADATVRDHASIVKTIREAFGITTPLTDRDAAAAGVLDLLDGPRRDPPPLPPIAREKDAAAGLEGVEGFEVARWAEGVRPDGTIRFNELQEGLLELKRQLDEQEGGPRGLESVAPPPTGYTSTAQLESTIEDGARGAESPSRHRPPDSPARRSSKRPSTTFADTTCTPQAALEPRPRRRTQAPAKLVATSAATSRSSITSIASTPSRSAGRIGRYGRIGRICGAGLQG